MGAGKSASNARRAASRPCGALPSFAARPTSAQRPRRGRIAAPPRPHTMAAESSTESASAQKSDDRLESWKEIAVYLKRDVTTVQRWEKKEALPIRRLPHEKQ